VSRAEPKARCFCDERLAFARDGMYGHHHSTRKAWDGPGEIRIVPPGGISHREMLFALRGFNRKKDN
jgi:hypothetical protein